MKKLLFLLLSLSVLPALAMELAQLKDDHRNLERELFEALDRGDITHAKALIQAGANVNVISNRRASPPLLAALGQDNTEGIRLLLDAGADIRIGGLSISGYERPLKMATLRGSAPEIRKERISLLITSSRFFGQACQQFLQKARRKTRARISVLNQIRPALPNDVKRLILAYDDLVWLEACFTPLFLHTEHYNGVTKMPLEVLRILTSKKALNTEKTIEILCEYKMAQLAPLMLEAAPRAAGPQPDNKEIQPLINHEHLEQNYGEAIRNHMRECLMPQSTGLLGNCSIQ